MQTIKNKIVEINQQTLLFKEALKVRINALPDNPKIQRITSSPNCFTINSHDIFGAGKSNILSPAYYDFKKQHESLCELIDKTEFVKLPDVLERLIKEKQIVRPNHHTIKFHPDVIKALDETLKENF